MKWCVIVPAYEARASIAAVVQELVRDLPPIAPGGLLVVDDGSTDGTGDAARAAGADVLVHPRNRGKGAALLTGLEEARARGFEAALTVDADGQHPGTSARALLEAAGDDPEALVLGVRDLAGAGAPRANRFSNGISNFFLSRFAGRPLGDTQCGLRRYPVAKTLELAPRAAGYALEAEVILLAVGAGVRVVEVPVVVRYPPEEERVSHFDPVKDPARIIAVVLRTVFGNVQR